MSLIPPFSWLGILGGELTRTWDHRLAMYYNGYIIICIFLGAYLGSFMFHWEPLGARDA